MDRWPACADVQKYRISNSAELIQTVMWHFNTATTLKLHTEWTNETAWTTKLCCFLLRGKQVLNISLPPFSLFYSTRINEISQKWQQRHLWCYKIFIFQINDKCCSVFIDSLYIYIYKTKILRLILYSILSISEGSCDTEDWSNDAENSALHHRNKLHFK